MYDRGDEKTVAFLAGASLQTQLASWQQRRTRCALRATTATAAAGVQRALRGATVVVVDATARPAAATEIYLHAVDRLGADGVVVYTEQTHEGLEFLVRRRGSWLLFGPLSERQWDEYFERALGLAARRSRGDVFPPRQVRMPREMVIPLRTTSERWPTGMRRPRTSA